MSATLGGNRTIGEPFTFTVGEPVSGRKEKRPGGMGEGGGLFVGGDGPPPPPALSLGAVGMKRGGYRSVLVPAELGYPKGKMELPPDTPVELLIEVLEINN